MHTTPPLLSNPLLPSSPPLRFAALESLERALRELLVPLVCLVENSATAAATAAITIGHSGLTKHGSSSKNSNLSSISSNHTALSTRDMTIKCSSVSAADCAAVVHPTVSVLADFICSNPLGDGDAIHSFDTEVHPFSSLPVAPAPTAGAGTRPGTGREMDGNRYGDRLGSEICLRKGEDCWVFAMFTDDTNLPLSLYLRDTLVTLLPQLPLFCLVSDSIVLPALTLPHIAHPDKPCPLTSPYRSADSDFSVEYRDLFLLTLDSIRLQKWDFGRAFSSAVGAGIGDDIGIDIDNAVHQERQQAELLGKRSFNSCIHGGNRVDWVTVRGIFNLPNVGRILNAGYTHHPQSTEVVQPPDVCRITIAGLIGGTISFRQAACDSFPSPLKQDSSDTVCLGAVRSFLLEADLVRCSCYRAITDGTLALSGIKVQSPQPAPGGFIGRQSALTASACSGAGGVTVKQLTCVKWVVPWLCALSAAARSALKRPNIQQVTPYRTDHCTHVV